jgi:hypothetical protein
MPDMVTLPDGTFLIVNGCEQGYAGFDTCQMPATTAILYTPNAPLGNRFTVLASTTIARLYHSEAALLDDGRVVIIGSTPNANSNFPNNLFAYPNEKRIEVYLPPYLSNGLAKPAITGLAVTKWDYGGAYTILATIPSSNAGAVKVALLSDAFITHSAHMNQRYISLTITSTNVGQAFTIKAIAPPNANVGPPGWYMLWVLDGPTPCGAAKWVWLGGDVGNVGNWPGF